MSGHSKWSSIKHQKSVADARRSGVFTKLANAISVAARADAEPSINFQLRLAIDRARAANMPKSNIDRAVARGAGGGEAGRIEEVLYEAYGPGGAAILIEVATDNKNRASAQVKSILNKFGGKLASAGAVQYQFEKKGQIIATPPPGKSSDEAEMLIIEAGAEDYNLLARHLRDDRDNLPISKGEQEGALGNDYIINTKPSDLAQVKDYLSLHQFNIKDVQIIWEPNQSLAVDDETSSKIVRLLEALDELDDVANVASNIE